MGNETWINKELQRIRNLNDKQEQERLFQLIDKIIEIRNEYEYQIYEYKTARLYEDMKTRGIEYKKSNINSSILKSAWEDKFTNGLTMKDKEEIYFDSYMWHIFSYEKREAKIGSKARQAFNRVKKNEVYCFFQNDENAFCIFNAGLLKASDLDHLDDVYIVDSEMKWTYVHTHESACGPYYARS